MKKFIVVIIIFCFFVVFWIMGFVYGFWVKGQELANDKIIEVHCDILQIASLRIDKLSSPPQYNDIIKTQIMMGDYLSGVLEANQPIIEKNSENGIKIENALNCWGKVKRKLKGELKGPDPESKEKTN